MFKSKITDKALMGMLLFLGLVVVLVVYFLPVKQLGDQISSLEADNSKIRNHISSLQQYYDNRVQYKEDTEVLRKQIVDIVSDFPSEYRMEDYIMQAVSTENAADISFSSINMNNNQALAIVDQSVVVGAGLEEYQQTIGFYEQLVTYNNEIDYDNLKLAIGDIFDSPYRANIESITYSCDEETGMLTGVIMLGYFYVTGNGVEYTAPSIPPYASGTDNIFGKFVIEDEVVEE